MGTTHYYVLHFDDSFEEFQSAADSLEKDSCRTVPTLSVDAEEEDKREAFLSVLRSLSSIESEEELSDDDLRAYVGFFESLYGGGAKFRQRYSDVCEIMFGYLGVAEDLDKVVPYQIDNLCERIGRILETARFENLSSRVLKCLSRLQDNIELERHRMRYMAFQNQKQKETAASLSTQFKADMERQLKEADERSRAELDATKDRLQKNYVTILGIFAAVVIAFMSATAFSSSVLQSMQSVSIYRLSFTMLVLGFFVFNLLCALFIFLGRFSDGSSNVGRYMAFVDVVFLILIAAVVFARLTHFLSYF